MRLFSDFEAVVTTSPVCLRTIKLGRRKNPSRGRRGSQGQEAGRRSYTWDDFLLRKTSPHQRRFHFEGSLVYFRACTSADDSAVLALLAETIGACVITDATSQCCGSAANLLWRRPDISRAAAEPVVGSLRLARADRILTDDAGPPDPSGRIFR